MKFQTLSVAMMLAAGLALGCDEANDAPNSSGDATQGAAESTGDAVESLKSKANEAGESLEAAAEDAYHASKEKIDETVEASKEQIGDVVESSQEKIDEAVESGKAKLHEMTAPEPAEETTAPDAKVMTLGDLTSGMSLSTAQADDVIAKVKELIGDKNYDTASQWISKLEDVKLPEGYADKVASLKSTLEKAQSAGDMLKGIGG